MVIFHRIRSLHLQIFQRSIRNWVIYRSKFDHKSMYIVNAKYFLTFFTISVASEIQKLARDLVIPQTGSHCLAQNSFQKTNFASTLKSADQTTQNSTLLATSSETSSTQGSKLVARRYTVALDSPSEELSNSHMQNEAQKSSQENNIRRSSCTYL